MMIESGHADYCLLRALSLMYEIEPDVKEARHVLNIASTAEVEVVDYFLMILDASAAGGENFDNAISSFIRFFRAQNLSTLWLDMVGWRTPYWIRARTFRWSRPMPDGFVLEPFVHPRILAKEMGGYMVSIGMHLGMITSISRLKFAFSVGMTANSVTAGGCLALVLSFMVFSLF